MYGAGKLNHIPVFHAQMGCARVIYTVKNENGCTDYHGCVVMA